MKTMNRTLLAALVAATLAAPAFAGDVEKHHLLLSHDLLASADQADAWRRWADEFSHEMRTSMGALFGVRVGANRVVKNAPYSAEVLTEANQPLPDGNVISKKTAGAVYRDAAGRTRQETGGDGKQRTIYISDPVEGKSVILSPGSKRAIVTPRAFAFAWDEKNKQVVRLSGTEIRVEDGKVFIDGKEVTGKVELKLGNNEVRVDGLKITIDGKDIVDVPKMSVKTIVEGEDGTRREEVRVQIVKSFDGRDLVIPMPPIPPVPPVGHVGTVPPVPPLPGASMMRFESMGKLGKGTSTALGIKNFDGVPAEGRQTAWTIPAGEIGNRAPITITSESWYSPELQVTVYSRYSDPRQGESIYRLSGIKRGEPPAELFRVPEGYEATSRDAARAKERQEREKERALQRLQRDQERLQKEQERIQRERERLKG
jgi:hypothetical protein